MGVSKKLSRTISYDGTSFVLQLYRGQTGAPNRHMGLGGKGKKQLRMILQKVLGIGLSVSIGIGILLLRTVCEKWKYFYGAYLQALGKFSRHPNTEVVVEILIYTIFMR